MPSLQDFQVPVSTGLQNGTQSDYDELIASTAQQYGVDPALIHSMVKHESNYDPKALSPKKAKGLMQLMDGTAQEMGVKDPFDPAENLQGGVGYFKKMLDAQGGDVNKALAAYNWGPGNFAKLGEEAMPQETKDYIAKVTAGLKPAAKEPGLLDWDKPIAIVNNPDGSQSSVRTISANIEGKEVLMPTVHPDGRIMSDKEAIQRYFQTGEHFGKYDTVEEANAAGKALHERHAQLAAAGDPRFKKPLKTTFTQADWDAAVLPEDPSAGAGLWDKTKALGSDALDAAKASVTAAPQMGKLPFGLPGSENKLAQSALDVGYGAIEGAEALVTGGLAFVGGQVLGATQIPSQLEGGVVNSLAHAYDVAEEVNKKVYHPVTSTGNLLLKPIELAFGTILGTVDKTVRRYSDPNVPEEEMVKRVKAAQYVTNTLLLGMPLTAKGAKKAMAGKETPDITPKQIEDAKAAVKADPNVPPEVKAAVDTTPIDPITDVVNKVHRTQAENKTKGTVTAKFAGNQDIVDGLLIEAALKEGGAKNRYNKVAKIIADHDGDAATLDLTQVKGVGPKTSAKIKEIIAARKKEAPKAAEPTAPAAKEPAKAPVQTGTNYSGPTVVGKSLQDFKVEPKVEGSAVNYSGPTLIGKTTKADPIKEMLDNFSTKVKADAAKFEERLFPKVDPVMNIPEENLSPRGKAKKAEIEAKQAPVPEPEPEPVIEPAKTAEAVGHDAEFDSVKIAKEEGYVFPSKRTFATLEEAQANAAKRGSGHDVVKVGEKYRVGKYSEESYPVFKDLAAVEKAGLEVGSEISKERASLDEKTEGFGVAQVGDKYYRTVKKSPEKVELEGKKRRMADEAISKADAEAEVLERYAADILDDGVTAEDMAIFEQITGMTIHEMKAKDRVMASVASRADKADASGVLTSSDAARKFIAWRDAFVAKSNAVPKVKGKGTKKGIKPATEKAPITKGVVPLLDDQFAIFKTLEEAQAFKEAKGRKGKILKDPMSGQYMIEPELRGKGKDIYDEVMDDFNGEDVYVENDGGSGFWDILNNERGSVDVTDLRLVIDKIEGVLADAKKMKMTVDKYLDMMGVEPAAAQLFLARVGQLPQMYQEIRDKDPLASKILLPEGKIVAQNVKRNKNKEIIHTMPPITEELANGVLNMSRKENWGHDVTSVDSKGKVRVTHVDNAFERVMRSMETKINAFRGPVRQLYRNWRDSLAEYKKEMVEVDTWLKDLKSRIAPERQRDFAIACYADMKSVKEAYEEMGITEIPKLTPEEMLVKKELLDYTRKFIQRANSIRTKTGKRAIRKLLDDNGMENYLPLFRDLNVLREMGVKEGFVTSDASRIGQISKTFNGLFNPHEKRRDISRIPIELDPFKAISKYANYGLKEIHIAPVAALAKELAHINLPHPSGKGKVTLQKWNPYLSETLSRWSDFISGKDPIATGMANMNPMYSRGMDALGRNLVIATIAGSIRTFLVQPSSFLVNTMTMLDMRSGAYGVAKLLWENPTGRNSTAARRSSSLIISEAELAYAELGEAMERGVMSGAKTWAADATMAPMKWMDAMVREATWNAADYFGRKRLKLTGEELAHFADDVVEKTQGLGIKGAVSNMQSGKYTKWLTLLQTFGISDFNFIMRDVLGIKNPEVNMRQSLVRAAKYTVATMLAGEMYKAIGLDNVLPDPIGAYQEAKKERKNNPQAFAYAAAELLEKIPIIGGSAKYSSSLGGIMGEWANLVPEATKAMGESLDWNHMSRREKRKNLMLITKAVGYTMGIPMTNQILKSVRTAYQGGNPYEVVMGIYLEEKAKRQRK